MAGLEHSEGSGQDADGCLVRADLLAIGLDGVVVALKIKNQTLAAQQVDEPGFYMSTVLCAQEQRQRYAAGDRPGGIADVEETVCGVCVGANLKARAAER